MKLITTNNYEAYLLDYVEGNLSPELIAELMLFFENHPDLKEELDEFDVHQLIPTEVTLIEKNKLKKDENVISFDNYEEFIIAEIETENTPEITNELHLFLKENPAKQLEFIDYQKTKLIASTIVFEDKKSLKKKERKVIPIYWWYTSAAAVLIILFLLKGFNNEVKQNENNLVEKEEISIPKEKNKSRIAPKEEVKKEYVAKEERINHPKKVNTNPKKNMEPVLEKEEPLIALMENSDEKTELIKDTVVEEFVSEEIAETIHYEDNVKITYEDELVVENREEKTKFDAVKAIINERIKSRFFQKQDSSQEEEAYAVNIAIPSFLKNKKKNKN